MRLLAFDLEFNPSTKKVGEFGYWSNNGSGARGRSLPKLFEQLDSAEILVGHNVIHHDLKILEELYGYQPQTRQFIDTLLLSSLLFAERPYHHLVKQYLTKVNIEEISDPALDSKLVLDELLPDLLAKWDETDVLLKQAYFILLKDQSGFSGFFRLINYQTEAAELNLQHFNPDWFCREKNYANFVATHPLEFAFALAFAYTENPNSRLPTWISYTYPDIERIVSTMRMQRCAQPACRYCSTQLSSVVGLSKFFGYDGYRNFGAPANIPLQQRIVESALKGESLISVLPTGGGKSLCFQVPALMAHSLKRALTVVISPLQSLMKDQVDNLLARNIFSAFTINGLVDPITRMQAAKAVEEGEAALLYLSPESLRSRTIRRLILSRQIERFVIDEAHCFSSWGHDFRPDYLYIAKFIKRIQEQQPGTRQIPVSCFTATARPEVLTDIAGYFDKHLGLQLTHFITQARRENLAYDVIPSVKDEKFDRLADLLSTIETPTIIYTARVKACEELAAKLSRYDFPALAYHGQLDAKVKKEQQDHFIDGDVNIMVATSAFGMGVDKSDVGHVIHYQISDSLENYVQESGRAGRDPAIKAKCHILFDERDLQKHFNLLNSNRLNKKDVDQIWRAIKFYKRQEFSKSALEIAEKAGWDIEMRDVQTRVKTAIAALEETGFVERGENATRLFASSFLATNFEQAREIIHKNTPGLPNKERQIPLRIAQYLISRQSTEVDRIALVLGLEPHFVGHWINKFKDWKIVGGDQQLEAIISIVSSKNSSANILKKFVEMERALVQYFRGASDKTSKYYLKEIHDNLIIPERGSNSFYMLQRLLNFWMFSKKIKKESVNSDRHWFYIEFRDKSKALSEILTRANLATRVLDFLISRDATADVMQADRKQVRIEFLISEVLNYLEANDQVQPGHTAIEEVLFYLILMDVISLEGGLLVFYSPMKITRLAEPSRRYTKADYEHLQNFYEHKTEQIHIAGEYAKKMLRSNLEAMHFVDDYFKLEYAEFLRKYFRKRTGKIKRPITDKQFRRIFTELSAQQLTILNDRESERILVAAGPGSGKTRLLVHKVAAVILTENIKPDQFLMLSFSRSAVQEIKERLKALIGTVYGVEIKTFHSYAFDLVGQKGDLERSENIIRIAGKELGETGDLLPAVSKKAVILVDEYQDIDNDQYELLKQVVRIAENARIIVVGDDDQNIYEFRGSSVQFMHRFQEDNISQTHFLTTNYRSKNNLVEFSNAFLKLIPGPRIKTDIELVAKDQRNGTINIHQYPTDSQPILDLANMVINHRPTSPTAILTISNKQALQVYSLLTKAGIATNLHLTRLSYRVQNILEMEVLTEWIKRFSDVNTGRVKQDDFDTVLLRLAAKFRVSTALPLVSQAVEIYQQDHKYVTKSDWLKFVNELRHEDLFPKDKNKVWISTMHKSKGLEFDAVYVYDDRAPTDAQGYRIRYVAMSRAKEELHIVTNQSHYQSCVGRHGELIQYNSASAPPPLIILLLEMPDINLGPLKRRRFQEAIQDKVAGEEISVPVIDRTQILNADELVLSKKGNEIIQKWEQEGYEMQSATIDHIVIWRDKEEDYRTGYRVPLPRVVMVKE